jgi:hypothetical protein
MHSRARGVDQTVEHLLSKYEALSSNSSTAKKKGKCILPILVAISRNSTQMENIYFFNMKIFRHSFYLK